MNKSAIRILHASPGTPAVDIYVNGDLVVQDLGYGEITDYLEVEPTEYNVKVFPAGETTNPALDVDLIVPGGEITTVTAVGIYPEVQLLPIAQTVKCPLPDRALVRFIHLSPDAPAVDVVFPDGTQLFCGVEYQEVTDYLPAKAGVYELQVRPSGVDTVIITLPQVTLKADHIYSIYALGRLEGMPDLKAMVIEDTAAYCERETEREVVAPRVPDVKPYQKGKVQIKLEYR